MKIRLLGAEFQTDRRTDMSKLVIAYRSFANALENDTHSTDERHWPHAILIDAYLLRCCHDSSKFIFGAA